MELNINGLAIHNGYLLAEKLNVERINRETSFLLFFYSVSLIVYVMDCFSII